MNDNHKEFVAVDASDENPVTRNFFCRANGCCDMHEWCRFWASAGECRINRHWMSLNCQLACNTCNRPPITQAFQNRASGRVTNPFITTTRRLITTTRFTTRPVITTTRRITQTTTRFIQAVTTPPRVAPSNNPLARCRQIQSDPSLAAEVLLRERLVFAAEDLSGRRQTLGLDKVVRSNIANACVPRLDDAECERSLCYNLYFRTMDGTCNNFRQPLRGAAYRPYTRLMSPQYDNGLSEPVSSIRNLRPSPREISRAILSTPKSVALNDFNMMVMQFGQFLAHDLSKTTLVPSAKCNVCQNIPVSSYLHI
ncbi:ShKT domain-containing protein [Aphelenchoides bicaudatus]|nr:ShKT domain-containing protein [Aphelenchoides bicaudatus]